MLHIYKSKKFDKEVRLMQKRGYKLNKLWDIVEMLTEEKSLPAKNKNHKLSGGWQDLWNAILNQTGCLFMK